MTTDLLKQLKQDFDSKEILVMGLGLHGGGVSSARFAAKLGAKVTVTDLRTKEELKTSVDALSGFDVRFVLGKHEEKDFLKSDMVIKNPAIPRSAPFLKLAKRIETDISLFLGFHPTNNIAITGSKGKSSTTSAIYDALQFLQIPSYLGGNITKSPLDYVDVISPDDWIVLELSSFQLGDLRLCKSLKKKSSYFGPSILTNLLRDHQDYYSNMDEYRDDKEVLFTLSDPEKKIIVPEEFEGPILKEKRMNGKQKIGTVQEQQDDLELFPELFREKEENINFSDLVPSKTKVMGKHQLKNLFFAGLALHELGLTKDEIKRALGEVEPVAHRMELYRTHKTIQFINDSAATMPDAVLASVESLSGRTHLICGGNDKKLDFSPFSRLSDTVVDICLLEGTATESIKDALKKVVSQPTILGTFSEFDHCLRTIASHLKKNDTVLLSAGAASFGLFLHEFDRGNKFREAVDSFIQSDHFPEL